MAMSLPNKICSWHKSLNKKVQRTKKFISLRLKLQCVTFRTGKNYIKITAGRETKASRHNEDSLWIPQYLSLLWFSKDLRMTLNWATMVPTCTSLSLIVVVFLVWVISFFWAHWTKLFFLRKRILHWKKSFISSWIDACL